MTFEGEAIARFLFAAIPAAVFGRPAEQMLAHDDGQLLYPVALKKRSWEKGFFANTAGHAGERYQII